MLEKRLCNIILKSAALTLILLCGNSAMAADSAPKKSVNNIFDEMTLDNTKNIKKLAIKEPPSEKPLHMDEYIYQAWVDAYKLYQRNEIKSSEDVVFEEKPFEQNNKITELVLNSPPSEKPHDMDEYRYKAWIDAWELSQRAFSNTQKVWHYKKDSSEYSSEDSSTY